MSLPEVPASTSGTLACATRRMPKLPASLSLVGTTSKLARAASALGFESALCPSFDTLGIVRPVVFHPKARDAIRAFPREIRDRLGKALFLLQVGEQPGMPLSRPMPSVAPGVSELRLHSEDGQFRTFYFTASTKGILVLHAFVKKSRQTPPSEIQLARKRLKEMQDED